MQRSPSSNNAVFATHDIIALICANTEDSDLSNLLTVSRAFLYCAAYCIWRRLPDAQPLLDLIPAENYDAKNSTRPTDLQADKSRLSRFDFYAHFVKELRIQPFSRGQEPNWRSLPDLVSRRPLLPNLRQLILDVSGDYSHWEYSFGSLEDLTSAGAFLCSSLLGIHLPSGFSLWLNPNTASQLLKKIVDTAPELRILHIYVQSRMGNVDAAFHTIIRLRNLRVLKCTSVMVDCEKLQLLGTLPQLESLQVVSWDGYTSGDKGEMPLGDWMLPPQSFPMLRHLTVHHLLASTIVQLWRLTPLIRPLASVNVRFPSDARLHGPLLSEIICDICKGSPQAQELSIDLGELDGEVIPAAALGHLQKLPLQRLRIISLDTDGLAHRILSMASLEYLDVDSMILTFRDLISIAKHMPRLQFLSSNLLLHEWPAYSDSYSFTPSPSMLCLVTEFTFSEGFEDGNFGSDRTMEDYLDTISRFLYTLWPQGVRCETVGYEYLPASKADEDNLRLLNHKIIALSQPKGLELPSSESCRSGWMYEF